MASALTHCRSPAAGFDQPVVNAYIFDTGNAAAGAGTVRLETLRGEDSDEIHGDVERQTRELRKGADPLQDLVSQASTGSQRARSLGQRCWDDQIYVV